MTQELLQSVIQMGKLVREAVAKANASLLEGDKSQGEEVLAGDDQIDRMELAITRKCAELLAVPELAADEMQEVIAVLRAIADLERIADHAEEVALISRDLHPTYPAGIAQRLQHMADMTSQMIQVALTAFASRDLDQLHRLREQEDTVEVAQRWLHAEILRYLGALPADLRTEVMLLFVSHNLGRMADHATNIGEWASFAVTGEVGRLKSYRPSPYSPSCLPLV